MNPQEIELASKIVAELKNATGQGYATYVQGTVTSNTLDLIGIVTCCLILITVCVWSYKKWNIGKANDETQFAYFIGMTIVAFVVIAVCISILNAILGIIAPEYTVIHEIVKRTI